MEHQHREQGNREEREFLKNYRADAYERPSVAADIVIFTVTDSPEENYRKLPEKELRILLVKRGGHPFKDMWALPGGFVRPEETVEETACRELKEETGVDCGYLEQLYTFSTPGRDPRTWVMSCTHMALLDGSKINVCAGDDASDAAWFKLSVRENAEKAVVTLVHGDTRLEAEVEKAFPPTRYRIVRGDGIAFDHAKIILYALERLRAKLDDAAVAFHLLPGHFTLSQLQQIYEVILARPLLAPAFRRKIAPYVEETGQYTGDSGHRPSQLFKKKVLGGNINEF